MKTLSILLGLALILPISALAELHTFRLPDGRELKPRLSDLIHIKTVVLKMGRPFGEAVCLSPMIVTIFRDWPMFLSPEVLKVRSGYRKLERR